MNLKFRLLTAAFALSLGVQAQITTQDSSTIKRACGTPAPDAQWDAWFNQKVEQFKKDRAAGKTQSTTYVIPMIVHVIHGGQAVGTYPNISQAQVNSQVVVLNNDYAGTGFNVGNLAATAFSAIGAANCDISFCLAESDPNGTPMAEPGIDRVDYTTFGWTNPAKSSFNTSSFQTYLNDSIKPVTIWDPTRYFNMWVTDVNNNVGLLGYATFPIGTGLTGIYNGNGTSSTDGVWVWSKAFGSTGTLQSPYNKGRTASHEIGHWLGLRHIGGDGINGVASCNATDYCNDTPPQLGGYSNGPFGQNYGAPTYPLYATGNNSCAGAPYGCMFMNFMDYVDDPSCYMFTPDQSARMTVAMMNGTFRSQLTASSATLCTTADLPSPEFTITDTGCLDSLLVTSNQSTGSPSPTYIWSVSPVLPGVIFSPNNTSATPRIKFHTASTYTVTMMASNVAGSATVTNVVTVNQCQASYVGIATNSLSDKNITLSPNPSSGIVTISAGKESTQNLDVTVYDYLGQFITAARSRDSSSGSYSLDLGNYANGVYFVEISNGQEKVVKRLILNK